MSEGEHGEQGYKEILVRHWIEKARNDLESARVNYQAGRFSNAVRDIYFASFHAVTAVLMKGGKTFRKHSAVRAAVHRDLIKTRRIDTSWGPFYEWIFDNRQQADYQPIAQFEADEVKAALEQAEAFVREMEQLLEKQ